MINMKRKAIILCRVKVIKGQSIVEYLVVTTALILAILAFARPGGQIDTKWRAIMTTSVDRIQEVAK